MVRDLVLAEQAPVVGQDPVREAGADLVVPEGEAQDSEVDLAVRAEEVGLLTAVLVDPVAVVLAVAAGRNRVNGLRRRRCCAEP